eukprot:Platyproteum_vivax@DN8745_c0_g1_i1.p1
MKVVWFVIFSLIGNALGPPTQILHDFLGGELFDYERDCEQIGRLLRGNSSAIQSLSYENRLRQAVKQIRSSLSEIDISLRKGTITLWCEDASAKESTNM